MKEEEINIEKLESLNVGTFGHIDHGKTTLVYKLTGKWADTHSEELKKGITIKLGYADCIIRKNKDGLNVKEGEPVRYLSFVDAPGHEMLMATMLSGAAMIDVALLVIAANEGIKPQTREHLMALQAKKIKNFIIVQNKIDLASKEQSLKNFKEIKALVKGTNAENAPIIPISAQQDINLDKVLEALINVKIIERDVSSKPIFVIARSFDVNRPGTKIDALKGGVLGGSLKKGKLKIGDIIEIKPGNFITKENQKMYVPLKTKITSIYRGKYKINEASPGGSLALETELDNVFTRADNLGGCVAGLENTLSDTKDKIRLRFSLFKEVLGISEHQNVENIKTMELLLLSINTSITIGIVTKISGHDIDLNLRIPVVAFPGENVGIGRNMSGHWRLIGFGEII